MAIQIKDLDSLVEQVNQVVDPKIKFYGSNGVLYVVTKDHNVPVGPRGGGNRRETYWFLQGMLAGAGASSLNYSELQKAYHIYTKYLMAEDYVKEYICYENTVDDPDALAEFEEDYGFHPDELFNPDSPHYIIARLVDQFGDKDALLPMKWLNKWIRIIEENFNALRNRKESGG